MIGAPVAAIVLLTYNQEQFVEEALLSLLNQDRDDIEIIVSDDCSHDKTWDRINTVVSQYGGSKRVILSQNKTNLGIVDNYHVAYQRSSANLIFMAAGDDISAPDRCSKCIQFWLDSKEKYDLVAADAIDMAYDGTVLGIKENDQIEDWDIDKWFDERPYFFGASHMVTRRLLDLAPLSNQLPYEDQCLVFRAMLMGGIVRLPIPLVYHRRGGMTQQPDNFKFAYRKKEIIRDFTREVEELKQFSKDAALLNMSSALDLIILQRKKYCASILELFQNPRSIKSLITFWKSSDVPLKDKVRYSKYFLFYPGLAITHGIRDILRLIRD
ncbi:glycosyltransferase [Polynucleobacter sp. MWH-UH25E]|uniref:glycosyltransferase n=1 Tax=Polynucleobacter sp. MWH-UH25E TaxID=1855616 RepID=UPI001BFD75A5|nr:glycosyltransferase [Polynucleobacter sp. MWH-UH25E]QWD62345.1 glycosyltransferase [Polynucleobacter sp. MWH-UH25E]